MFTKTLTIILFMTLLSVCMSRQISHLRYHSKKTKTEKHISTRNSATPRKHTNAGLPPSNVLDGESAPYERFPYVCQLTYSDDLGFGRCAGILIEPFWILTVAHCLNEEEEGGPKTIEQVVCGVERPANASQKESFSAVAFYIHELFNPEETRLQHDIALVKLDKALDIDLPILASNATTNKMTDGYITGWGEFDDTKELSEDLLVGEVEVVDNEICRGMWEELYPSLVIDEGRICTGGDGSVVCVGDSGGPLIAANSPSGIYENGIPTKDNIVGLASFGECDKKYPSVYTRISTYMDWIEETMSEKNKTKTKASLDE